MPSDSPRDVVLSRIRQALDGRGRGAVSRPAAAGVRTGSAGTPVPPRTLLAQFVEAARAADAKVSVVATPAEARRQIAAILTAEGTEQVLVSPDAADAPWYCGGADAPREILFITRSAVRNDLRDDVLKADVGVTAPAWALADTGTLVMTASAGDHRLDSLLPPHHVALVLASRLVPDLFTLFDRLAAEGRFARHSAITFVRGPSRTADIELTLTIGVHGPRALSVVVLDDLRG
ncbi:MAG: lactate utilization protein [Acidobacteriota bacterium]|nr:lactate utilization protein [Acidobacteriota bacterium]